MLLAYEVGLRYLDAVVERFVALLNLGILKFLIQLLLFIFFFAFAVFLF